MERQKEADEISGKCDTVIVIGGKNSSNTKKLFSISKKNCENTFHIEKMSELKEIDFSSSSQVGIISGASTPDWIIKEGISYMSDLNKPTENNDIEKAEENTAPEEKVDSKVEEKTNINVAETDSQQEAEVTAEVVAEENLDQEPETVEEAQPAQEDEADDTPAPEAEEKTPHETFMEDVEKSFCSG